MDVSPEHALKDSLKSLRISGKYSDMRIVCGGDTYYVHKAIMCPRSKYFEAAFNACMLESRISYVDLSEHNPDAVKLVVDFFYLADYQPLHRSSTWRLETKKEATNFKIPDAAVVEPDDAPAKPEDTLAEPEDPPAEPGDHDPWEVGLVSKKGKKKKKGKSIALNEPAGPSNPDPDPDPELVNLAESLLDKTFLITHCRVYALADYLQVNELKALAAGKFRAEAEKHWNHPDFFEAVQEVYRTSVRSDRLIVYLPTADSGSQRPRTV